MGKDLDRILAPELRVLNNAKVFWIATAPSLAHGRVNVSPKGLDSSFTVLLPTGTELREHPEGVNGLAAGNIQYRLQDSLAGAVPVHPGFTRNPAGQAAPLARVMYLDVGGSGSETSAHLLDNGRCTVMFHAFDGDPGIVRFFGYGRTVVCCESEDDPDYAAFADVVQYLPPAGLRKWKSDRPMMTGPQPQERGARNLARAVIVIDVYHMRQSCGYSVPLMEYRGWRENFDAAYADEDAWGDRKTRTFSDGNPLNNTSLDGIPTFLSKGLAPRRNAGGVITRILSFFRLAPSPGGWSYERRVAEVQRWYSGRDGTRQPGLCLLAATHTLALVAGALLSQQPVQEFVRRALLF